MEKNKLHNIKSIMVILCECIFSYDLELFLCKKYTVHDLKISESLDISVQSACPCQITFTVMHLRTRHQPDICADCSGLYTQRAAGPGIVRTWKGTSLWGTQRHTRTCCHPCLSKESNKINTPGIIHAYMQLCDITNEQM